MSKAFTREDTQGAPEWVAPRAPIPPGVQNYVTPRGLRLLRDVLTASRRAFQLSEQQLRAGTADIVTVLNTQLTLFQAEDALSQAQLARLLAIVSLYQALGGGWEPKLERPVNAL